MTDPRDLSEHLEALQRFGGKMPAGDINGKASPADLRTLGTRR